MSVSAKPYVPDCYVVWPQPDGTEKVLVLYALDRMPPRLLAEHGTERVGMAPSFETIGLPPDKEETVARGEVWFYGRQDCTGPTYMARSQAEWWIKGLKRGEIRSRGCS